jgi:regulator of protease activity HflC (stomatin/prohibitin superfamily)
MCTIHIKTILCSWFVLAIVLSFVFINIGSVEQEEYAVALNSYTMQFRDQVYSQGTFILSPGDTFIRFKRTVQSIELGEIDCLTKDEVLIDIEVSAQFQYIKDDLIPYVMKQFGDDEHYKDFLVSIMRSTILNSCLEFTALDYYEMRTVVDAEMFKSLVRAMNTGLGCTIEYFQLVDIKYPSEYISTLHKKQNIKQDLITAENHRSTEVIGATTTKLEAQRTANINLINAYNARNITMYSATTQRQAIVSQWVNRGSYFKHVMHDLKLSFSQFIEYLKSDVVRSSHIYSSL